MNVISETIKQYFRTDLPELQVGDVVNVITKIFNKKEKDKHHLVHFKGEIISQKNRNQIGYTFSVLKESKKIAIRSVFSYHSPLIVEIKILPHAKRKIRRAKLYYLEKELVRKKNNI